MACGSGHADAGCGTARVRPAGGDVPLGPDEGGLWTMAGLLVAEAVAHSMAPDAAVGHAAIVRHTHCRLTVVRGSGARR